MPEDAPKKVKFRSTQKQILDYALKLDEVHQDLKAQGKAPVYRNLLSGLEAKGFKGTRRHFDTIRKAHNMKSDFIVKLSQSQYSGYVEEIWNKLSYIEDKALELAEDNWQIRKRRTGDATEEGSRNTWQEVEDNQYKPKHDFMDLAVKVQKQKMDLLKGDTLNVSVAMLEQKFQQLEEESNAKSQQIANLQKKLKAVQKDG